MKHSLFVKLATESIRSIFDHHEIDRESYLASDPRLSEYGASFVTLTIHGRLRGCIGSIVAHRILIEDIIGNARSAAIHDPRFQPLEADELERIDIEVSLLTPPVRVEYRDTNELKSSIRPGIDGVIMKLNHNQATFLPQVWDELNNFDAFFSHLGIKAGIGSDPLSYHPDIYRYQVEKYL